MHEERRGTALIAILLLSALALVAITGYFWFKNNMQGVKQLDNQSTNNNISTTPPRVDTESWQTCANSNYGYSIKYPTGFSLDKTTCSDAPDPQPLDAIPPDSAITDFQKNWVLNISVENSF